jgi:hypothetical protein
MPGSKIALKGQRKKAQGGTLGQRSQEQQEP